MNLNELAKYQKKNVFYFFSVNKFDSNIYARYVCFNWQEKNPLKIYNVYKVIIVVLICTKVKSLVPFTLSKLSPFDYRLKSLFVCLSMYLKTSIFHLMKKKRFSYIATSNLCQGNIIYM